MSDSKPLPDQGEPMAALRDASGYRTHRHTITSTYSHVPAYHVVNPDEPYMSRCGRPIDPSSERPARAVFHRCMRPGCKQGWPVAASEGTER